MPRPVWKPDTDEQRQLLDAAIVLAQHARDADAAAWEAFAAARDAGVPVTLLAEKTGLPRATVYRRLGATARPAQA